MLTAAVWMAAPPEVHSALLSQGPGPGPLLAAAAAWNSLSVEYAAVADEVSQLVAAVRSGSWEGAAAESFVAAHLPYAAWLVNVSAETAATAVQQEVAAAAYSAALAVMPTLPELAANRTTHVALVATNFFGINAIPIAVNESDYVRMWIQAATTMTVYQASSGAAVASTPQSGPAPQVVRSAGAPPAASLDPGRALLRAFEPFLNSLGIDPLIRNPLVSNVITEFIADILEYFGVNWNPGAGLLNGLDYEYYADATQPMWYLARGLELIGDTMQMSQNPAQALQYFVALSVFDWPTHIAQLGTAIMQSPLLLAAAGGAMMVPAGAAGGLAGLAGLAATPHPAAPAELPSSASVELPATGMTSPATSFVSSSAAPTPATIPPGGPAPAGAAPLTPSTAGPGFMAPYVVGPPGIGFDSGMTASASAGAKRKAPEPDSAAAAATSPAAIRRQARARQRKRTAQRQHGDEFMDMDVEVAPEFDAPLDDERRPAASERGAGHFGLPGTVSADPACEAAGLTTLTGDRFGGGPTTPMVPSIWR